MDKSETVEDLAWRYCWEQCGNTFILSKANGEFIIAENTLIFVCNCCNRRTIIKTDLTKADIKNIIKSIGHFN